MKPVQDQTPPLADDGNMRSIMLERLSIVAASGGLEMEEKLQSYFGGRNLPSCSFLWTGDPDHQLYKQKIAQYTKSPPPSPPSSQVNLGAVNALFSQQASLVEQFKLCLYPSPFSLAIPQGMMRKEFGIIKFTAQFAVRYGLPFRLALRDRVSTDTQFKFLLATDLFIMSLGKSDTCDILYRFYCKVLVAYGRLIKEWANHPAGLEAILDGFFSAFNAFKKKQDDEEEDALVDVVETDWRNFDVYDEYFVDIENREFPSPLDLQITTRPPSHIHARASPLTSTPDPYLISNRFTYPPGRLRNPFKFTIAIPEVAVTRKELGIMKFTAQFVVRYGNEFWDGLWGLIGTSSEFHFLDRNHENKPFSQLILAYGDVIKPWRIRPRKSNTAMMQAVLDGFLSAFDAFKAKQKEEDEDEVVEKLITDRRYFLVDKEYFRFFLDMEERIARPPPVHEKPESRRRMPPPPHEEPEPKREKLDESDLVSEEEFLARHPEECLQSLQSRIDVAYDSTIPLHQEALRELWKLSFPEEELHGLISEQWKEMGWQGKDPSTDFRGGGFISLENLLYFARNFQKSFQDLLRKQVGDRSEWEYPFAVAGINLTFMLIQMLDLEAVKPRTIVGATFLKFLSENEYAFDLLYCIAFKLMDQQWLSMRASYMELDTVMKSTRRQLERELMLEDIMHLEDLPSYALLTQ